MGINTKILKIEDDGIYCDQRTLATLLGMAQPNVSQLVTDGVFMAVGRGRYDIFDCVQKFVDHVKRRHDTRRADTADFGEEKARLTRAQADKAEMEAKEMAKELVRVDDVLEEWQGILASVKGKLLSIPSKAATLVAVETNPALCQVLIDDMIRETLNELANYGESRGETNLDIGYDGSEAASETHDLAMG